VRHPARVFERIAFEPANTELVYLSFPISKPRKMAAKGDRSGISEVNAFVRRMVEFQRAHQGIVCLCPLSIDEIPLVNAFRCGSDKDAFVEFDLAARWDTDAFHQGDVLLTNDSPLAGLLRIPRRQLADARGLITNDVGLRDKRLVLQSRRVVVFNPCFVDPLLDEEPIAGGVEVEIDCAGVYSIPVHIFQDPKRDPDGLAQKRWRGSISALGGRPASRLVSLHDSLDDLLSRLPQ
jgi:hypothetical protein